ncbi:MAG: glycosyltransferase [Candidatus Diapherotrites archaeon]|uniref:Glycosyltransferase n=1 Tax=Candidatus Iainarchaeum sp. TaxID=3101447 RepID=A0A8T4KSJ1_9ARCH|nr:glycosyltransferase [Candidatus Diapherotrites archaeon]
MQTGRFGKPVIIIPAYNEEKLIGRAIDLIKGTGVDANIIVANDGSTDRTAEISARRGCRVVSLPKNFGKSNVFFAGVKEALKTNPVAVVTIDADAIAVPKEGLYNMINDVAQSTKTNKIKMIVAPVRQKSTVGYILETSGVRAFSLPALYRLHSSKFKGTPEGRGLESFLNRLFKGWRTQSDLWKSYHGFEFEKPFRVDDYKRRVVEGKLTKKRIQRRMQMPK